MTAARGKANTKATRLVDRLREAIVSGEFEPGGKINLAKVRATYEISLSPLREALARLIADGLVEFRDNRGYWVSPVDLENLREVIRLRTEFELCALRAAIETGDVNWESDVMRAVHTLSRSTPEAGMPDAGGRWEAAHRDFHMTLLSGCGMPTLLSFCRSLLDRSDRYRRIFVREDLAGPDILHEHGEIARAAVARDMQTACARLADHIGRVGDAVARRLTDDAPNHAARAPKRHSANNREFAKAPS
ncbi:MAG: FCD domain-containing protein [Alphaproteobacteria bacterium]|nr:FCD domain-containing protein [Alphaproteobacteria bacterium]